MPIHLLIPDLRGIAAGLLLPIAASAQVAALPDGLYAEITTPRGVITCELEFQRAPLTVANFVGLAEGTLGPAPRRPFFDGLTFHRVVPNFVIQGGDPLATGEGGPGYSFPDEFVPGLGHGSVGALSMANDGPDTNGSQFFITLAPVDRLNFLHSAFGRTVRGLDVLPRITQGDAMRVRIIRNGAAAVAFRADEAAFLALSAKAPRYSAEMEPGPMANFDDPDLLLPADPPRARNFNFKLGNVERATGLRIYARVYARFVPVPGAADPAGFSEALADRLGLDDNSVLAVYFEDSGQWTLRLGDALVGRFTGLPGNPRELERNGTLISATKAFLEDSNIRAAQYAAQSATAFPNILQIPGQRIRLSVDAVLDGLIEKLAP